MERPKKRIANERGLLPISMLAEYFYCPRNFYLRYVEGREETNARMEEGRISEEARRERKRVIRGGRIQEHNIPVVAEKLGVTGFIDILESQKNLIYPVEYKSGTAKDSISHRVQICAQAMALEEMTGIKISFGYLYYHGSCQRIRVDFTEDLRTTVIEGIKAALNIASQPVPPEPVADSRCESCSLQGICLPYEYAAISSNQLNNEEQPKPHTPMSDTTQTTPSRPVATMSLGNILYIDKEAALVTKRSGRLVVSKFDDNGETSNTKTIREIPTGIIEQVITVGNVAISHHALRHLMRNGIEIVCLSSTGKYEGRFTPAVWKNANLRIHQVEKHRDYKFRLNLARAILGAKIANSKTLLMRFWRRSEDAQLSSLKKILADIEHILASLQMASSIESMLGLEGKAASSYFHGISKVIKDETRFSFDSRNRRPPKDPVNAMLSFGYTLLMSDCLSACLTVGLDPYVGFLHSQEPGRPSLPLDIMEEFRAPIVDSAVITMINKGIIQEEDFESVMGTCLMNESGREKFFRTYRSFLNTEVVHPTFGYRISRRRCIEIQVRLLAKVISGELETYIPYKIR